MRLIDADEMLDNEQIAYIKAQSSKTISAMTRDVNKAVHAKIQMLIADTPTVEAKPIEWIPCSERLPAESIPVLTCDKTGWVSVNINIPYHGKKNPFECGYYTAWMPLPAPYNVDMRKKVE